MLLHFPFGWVTLQVLGDDWVKQIKDSPQLPEHSQDCTGSWIHFFVVIRTFWWPDGSFSVDPPHSRSLLANNISFLVARRKLICPWLPTGGNVESCLVMCDLAVKFSLRVSFRCWEFVSQKRRLSCILDYRSFVLHYLMINCCQVESIWSRNIAGARNNIML